MLKRVALCSLIATMSAAAAQQHAKPNRTISYFKQNDPKHGELLVALRDELKCATVDVDVYDDTTNIDASHETWWLLASPKEYSGYKKYRFNYVLEPPGTLTPKDMVVVVSDKTSRGLAERVCSEVTGAFRGARIHMK